MKKLSRIVGPVLALVMAVTLVGLQSGTALADDQEWSKIINPEIVDQRHLTFGDDILDMDVSADGQAIWLAVDDTDDGQGIVFRSTRGGSSFSDRDVITTPASGTIEFVAMSPDYDSDNTVFAASTTNVFRSTDDGNSWYPFAGAALAIRPASEDTDSNAVITALDVAKDSSGNMRVMVSTYDPTVGEYGDVYLYKADTGTWGIRNVDVGTSGNVEVIDVTFTPTHQSDGAMFAVVTGDQLAGPVNVVTQFSDSAWGDNWYDSEDIPTTGASGTFTRADIAFPADFDVINIGQNRYFLGLTNPGGNDGDVYRITGRAPGSGFAESEVEKLDRDQDMWSVAYLGNIQGGTLFAGHALTKAISITDDTLANDPTWNPAVKAPFGENSTIVRTGVTGDNVYATVAGDDGGFHRSTDEGVTFDGMALLQSTDEYVDITGLAINPDNPDEIIVVSQDYDNYTSNVWRTSNNGDNWIRIWADTSDECKIDEVHLSPNYKQDMTFFLVDIDGTRIWKTNNNGRSFVGVTAVKNIKSVAVENGTSIIVGHEGGEVQRSISSGLTWTKSVTGSGSGDVIALLINPDDPTEVFSINESRGGSVGQIRRSRDSTASFRNSEGDIELGEDGIGYLALGNSWDRRKALFAASTEGLWRQVWGTDLEWEEIGLTAEDGGPVDNVSGMVVYEVDTLAVSTGDSGIGIWRSTNAYRTGVGTAPKQDTRWSRARRGLEAGDKGDAASTKLLRNIPGTNELYLVETESSEDDNDTIYRYRDNLTYRINLGLPASKASVEDPDRLTFTWSGLDLPDGAFYRLVVAYDDGFDQTLPGFATRGDTSDTEGTSYRVVPVRGGILMEPGKTYYWFVQGRFEDWSGDDITSPRGRHAVEGRRGIEYVNGEFSTGVAKPGLVSPIGGPLTGGVDAPLMPVLQWTAVEGANRYELQVDTSASFFNPFVNLTDTGRLDATAYQIETPLEYSTTYYWRVRAATFTSVGEWSTVGGFTTMAEPTEPPPPIVVQQPPPQPDIIIQQPATPSWVWVVIIIGAILVIIMVVLIVRTRRV